jgi:hypothetical protein
MPTERFVNASGNAADGPHACPCCGYLTLGERAGFEICEVCYWEDDGQDDHDADRARGGPNGSLSLTEARQNFDRWGASEKRFQKRVRPPADDEHPIRGE